MLKNKDLEILCEIEHLLHKKLVQTNAIKEIYNGRETYYFDENDKEYDKWCDYYNLIEKIMVKKEERNRKNYQRIKEKRKTNKNYARSKKEIERRKKANTSIVEKESE